MNTNNIFATVLVLLFVVGSFSQMAFAANSAPHLASIGNKYTQEGEKLTFKLTADDADGDQLTFSVENAENMPARAYFYPDGSFSWVPTYDQAGLYIFTFVVSDNNGGQDSETMAISVENVNQKPYFLEQNLYNFYNLKEDTGFMLDLEADDDDKEQVTFGVENMPKGAIMTKSGTFIWTPDHEQQGLHQITFTVSDGKDTTKKMIEFDVMNVNRVPVVQILPEQEAIVGKKFTLQLKAVDADGDALNYNGKGEFQYNYIDQKTGVFTWTPTAADLGSKTLNFWVADATHSADGSVKIMVKTEQQANANQNNNQANPNQPGKTAEQLKLEQDIVALEQKYSDLEDDYFSYKKDYLTAVKQNNKNDIDKYTTKLNKIDNNLNDLKKDAEKVLKTVGIDDKASKNKLEALIDDIKALRGKISDLFVKPAKEEVKTETLAQTNPTGVTAADLQKLLLQKTPPTSVVKTGANDVMALGLLAGGILIVAIVIVFLLGILLSRR